MRFDPIIAQTRFGTGVSSQGPADTGAILAELDGFDEVAARFPVRGFGDLNATFSEFRNFRRMRNQAGAAGEEATEGYRQIRRNLRIEQFENLNAAVARAAFSRTGFRERLALFWADHFTVSPRDGLMRHTYDSYVEDAIRPHISGRFGALLRAAIMHPMMLVYLDQHISAGTGSRVAMRRGRGLNENLAREVLELHTLGVDGNYQQADVRQLAELFAGMSYRPGGGFVFRPNLAGSGAQIVLGTSYGGQNHRIEDIETFLEDLALHPDTAAHLARKLAVHFVSDTPDAAMVAHIEARYLETGGDLFQCYAALLEHPSSWEETAQKIRQPFEFISASVRALDMDPDRLTGSRWQDTRLYLAAPMRQMGQTWGQAPGPDGWPEDAGDWITPQGLAGRIQWAMTVPRVLRPDLPDPRDMLRQSLGERVSGELTFAVEGAESRWEAIGILLASPEFQRR